MTVAAQDSDYSWLAVDVDGSVGWFTVNGGGAILLRPGVQPQQLFAAEDALSECIRGEGHAFVFGDGEQWRATADAGLFAYDYSRADGGYKVVARPSEARPVSSLPGALAGIAALTTFERIRFATTRLLTTSDLEDEDDR